MSTTQSAENSMQAQSWLAEIMDLVQNAKVMPFSSSILIPQEEILYLLEQLSNSLPKEIQQAQKILKSSRDYLDDIQREGEQLIEEARVRAERMVQRTEIARQANIVANRERENARQEAKRIRYETANYCNKKIESLDQTIDKLSALVKGSREKIQKEFIEELSPDQVTSVEDYTNLDEVLEPNKDHFSDISLFDQDNI